MSKYGEYDLDYIKNSHIVKRLLKEYNELHYNKVVSGIGLKLSRTKELSPDANQDIKNLAAEEGIILWEIADALGVRNTSFVNRLKYVLSGDDRYKLVSIMLTIKEDKQKKKEEKLKEQKAKEMEQAFLRHKERRESGKAAKTKK